MPHVRILFISTNENATYVRTVFATGVLGYILKSAAQSELFQAVKQIYRGRRFIDPRLKESLSEDFLSPVAAPATQSVKHLSRREIEVLRAVALGFTTREISKEMKLSQKTVQTLSGADIQETRTAHSCWPCSLCTGTWPSGLGELSRNAKSSNFTASCLSLPRPMCTRVPNPCCNFGDRVKLSSSLVDRAQTRRMHTALVDSISAATICRVLRAVRMP